jgi:hypothetical protein
MIPPIEEPDRHPSFQDPAPRSKDEMPVLERKYTVLDADTIDAQVSMYMQAGYTAAEAITDWANGIYRDARQQHTGGTINDVHRAGLKAVADAAFEEGVRWAFTKAASCTCTPAPQDAGGGYTEYLTEYEPTCPEHSTHLYDPRTGNWILRPEFEYGIQLYGHLSFNGQPAKDHTSETSFGTGEFAREQAKSFIERDSNHGVWDGVRLVRRYPHTDWEECS